MKLSLGQVGGLATAILQLVPHAAAIDLGAKDTESLKAAARTAAQGLKTFYSGNTPGLFDNQNEYSWWICGGMFMTLIEYWNLTGDDQFNDLVKQGLIAQVGPDKDYRPVSQVWSEANDDQLYWGLAAMTAAEFNFENPNTDGLSWLGLAQAVFNRIAPEWDGKTCGGGFRWQYSHKTTSDYFYKNTPTNGGFFQIGARLATYTGNHTYADWAEKTWDWFTSTPSFQETPQKGFTVWDGGHVQNQCQKPTKTNWTYNYGTFINGASYLYRYYDGNAKEQAKWKSRLQGLIKGASFPFLPKNPQWGGGKILVEWSCELSNPNSCNTDETTFMAYFVRWITTAMIIVDDPEVNRMITPWLEDALDGAAAQCSGDHDLCGQRWYTDTYDGSTGVGQQMSAVSLFANNIVLLSQDRSSFMPLTDKTGGTSKSHPSAGTGPQTVPTVPGLNTTSLWGTIKTPVTVVIVVVVLLIAVIAGYFIWRKWFRKPKVTHKDVDDFAHSPQGLNSPGQHVYPNTGYVR